MANKDCEDRRIGSRARSIVHYQFNSDHWEYKEETGNDNGRDCVIELSEDGEWRNHKIEGQIKGTKIPTITKDNMISFPMPVKTIEYALGTSVSFVLFVVDVQKEITYCQCIQLYFIEHKELFEKMEQKTINIRIPKCQTLENCDSLLITWARKVFVGGPRIDLKEYVESKLKRE